MKTKIKQMFSMLGRSSACLVCETDGFMLHAAVVRRVGTELAVLHTAQAQEKDLKSTLARVVALLEEKGWKPGGNAILVPGYAVVMTSGTGVARATDPSGPAQKDLDSAPVRQ